MGSQSPRMGETTCGSLLKQLQQIWDEVGESEKERDRMLLQLEQECLDVYKKKVDQAAKSRAQLLQALADSKAELSRLVSALGEREVISLPEKSSVTIKEQLAAIAPLLEQLWKKKEQRIREFTDVQSQIQTLCGEISGNLVISEKAVKPVVDEEDLSLEKLEGYHVQLKELRNEKTDRLHKVLDLVKTVHDLCAVLGMDFVTAITQVHSTLGDSVGVQSKSISNDTLSKLAKTVIALTEDKKQRLHKLHELAQQLFDLWNLMDTSTDERMLFDHITRYISSSVDEVTAPRALAVDLIEQAEMEVERLDQLKASKMKEIAFKKQTELEEIYSRAHVEIDTTAAREKILSLIDSGNVEPSELLANMDDQILNAREEALSRKEILEKVDRWMAACEEESWLEDYNQDENRYNSSRGAHLNLKRAEKARFLVNKIPAMVDTLVAKTRAWEEDRAVTFMYDGVPLLAMLEEYALLRHDREEAKRRMRDQKRFQEQAADQESLFGSRPSPARHPKKTVGSRTNGSSATRRLSLQSCGSGSRSMIKDSNSKRDNNRPVAPLNYVAIAKEDVVSHVSSNEPLPVTP